jgi:NhaP-type Na+/H+ and K+/H+ antiporter
LSSGLEKPFLEIFQSFSVGIVFAIIIGYIVINILKKNYFDKLTHLAVVTSAIIIYVGSEYMNGLGVLSVAIFGIMFGNSHISHLLELEKFEDVLSNSLKILTFMFLGTLIFISPEYMLTGSLLFLIGLLVRFFSILYISKQEKINFKEILFMTLNTPKNIEIVVVLILGITLYPNMENIEIFKNITMLVVLYSIALATVVGQFTSWFLDKNVKKVKRN